MELIIAEETDRQKWDDVVDRSPNGTIFHSWKWLKILEKHSCLKIAGIRSRGELYPLFIMDKEKAVGIYPLFFFKNSLIRSCYSPPTLVEMVFLGPLFPGMDSMKEEKKQIFIEEVQKLIDRFIKKDQKANYIQINTTPGYEDCRSFRWSGYTVEPMYTYYIDISQGTDLLWKSFNRSLRYYIEKARKEGITVTDGTKDDVLFIYDLLKERGRIASPKELMGDLFSGFSPNHLKVFMAKTNSETLSGIITILYKDKVTFWAGAPRCSYKGLSPNELLLWESIRWAAEQGYKTFEIEGADDYSLFPFKRKFNGKVIPYYKMKWMSPSLKVISSVYHSLRKDSDEMLEPVDSGKKQVLKTELVHKKE